MAATVWARPSTPALPQDTVGQQTCLDRLLKLGWSWSQVMLQLLDYSCKAEGIVQHERLMLQ